MSLQEIFASDSPTLAQIRNHLGEMQAIMIVSLAIEDVNRLFRADRRMEEADIVFVAKRIVRQYWYLKPEDLKKCFEGRRPKSFVLEGDSFMSWIAEYDLMRDKACEDDAANHKIIEDNGQARSYSEFLDRLNERAKAGEPQAIRILADINYIKTKTQKTLSEDERRKKEIKFRVFKRKYEQARSKNNGQDAQGPKTRGMQGCDAESIVP